MRPLLARRRIRALVPLDLHGLAELAVGADGQEGQVAAAVVGDAQPFAGLIECEVAGAFAAGRYFVEERQLAGLGVNFEGTHRIVAALVDGVEKTVVGAFHKE